VVDGQLAGKEYLMGEHFSVADGYLYTVGRWTKPMGIDISGYPNLRRTPSAWRRGRRCRKR
jgi:glutathione S-transferase